MLILINKEKWGLPTFRVEAFGCCRTEINIPRSGHACKGTGSGSISTEGTCNAGRFVGSNIDEKEGHLGKSFYDSHPGKRLDPVGQVGLKNVEYFPHGKPCSLGPETQLVVWPEEIGHDRQEDPRETSAGALLAPIRKVFPPTGQVYE